MATGINVINYMECKKKKQNIKRNDKKNYATKKINVKERYMEIKRKINNKGR